ncbi:hypothetical protein BSKO_07296 [Bryopsis sp. KO-2023]|nr:hypothetical protein BSKO_07296 [Bryopsis sp. KO-2023]
MFQNFCLPQTFHGKIRCIKQGCVSSNQERRSVINDIHLPSGPPCLNHDQLSDLGVARRRYPPTAGRMLYRQLPSLHQHPVDMKSALCSVLLAACLASALAFPNFWPGRIDPDAICDNHPEDTQKGHAAPVVDEDIEFTLKKGKQAKTEFCPGRKYSLTVEFSEPSRALLTSSAGMFKQNEAVDTIPDCPTRKNLSGDPDNGFRNTEKYKVEWTAPCDDKIDEITFKVTGAIGANGGYVTNTATITQQKKCTKLRRCK